MSIVYATYVITRELFYRHEWYGKLIWQGLWGGGGGGSKWLMTFYVPVGCYMLARKKCSECEEYN